MPTRSKKREYSSGFKGFIQCELTDKQKQALKSSAFGLEDLDNMTSKLSETGYKISMGYDTYNSCYQASLTCSQEDGVNNGWCLTGRGSTPVKALKQLFYKHYTIFREDWTHGMGLTREEFDD